MPTDAQIAGGHKANLNNPNTSQESKEHSKQVLGNEFNGGDGSLSYPPSPGTLESICFLSFKNIVSKRDLANTRM